ncbi:MAG: peptidoglycan-binding protein [Candidatus Omnitrophica bacterium]|nr:peptidoglycan-binding protein [Candidatus Omnitrophota bacterium]
MNRKGLVMLVIASIFLLSGCATRKHLKMKEMDIQSLKNQVSVLESQIQSKDEEINSLKDALARAQEKPAEVAAIKHVSKKKVVGEVKSRPNIKQIQIALQNAGYNPGLIDGKMGKQTVDAIKMFQRNANIKATGHVNKRTWALLRQYLYKKTK